MTSEIEQNPVEIKYYKLARSLLRGLVDPNLKPNKIERARISAIVTSPDNMTQEEQTLLWKFRHTLISDKKALTKFVCCVDWNDSQEIKQAATYSPAGSILILPM